MAPRSCAYRVFFSRSDRGHRDRIGAVVQGPARRHRSRSGAHSAKLNGQFRSGAARHRHAAQRLSADLPAHTLRFRLHAGEERVRDQRHRRRGFDCVGDQLVGRQYANFQQGSITFTSGVECRRHGDVIGSVAPGMFAHAALSAAKRAGGRATASRSITVATTRRVPARASSAISRISAAFLMCRRRRWRSDAAFWLTSCCLTSRIFDGDLAWLAASVGADRDFDVAAERRKKPHEAFQGSFAKFSAQDF